MITELTGFRALAEVMGEIHVVEYKEGALLIADLTLEDVGRILDLVSAGKVVGVRAVGGVPLPGGAPAPRRLEAAPSPPSEAAEAPSDVPPAPPADPPPAARAAPAEAPRDASPPAAPPAPPSGNGTAPPEIVGAPNFRAIVAHMRDAMGLKTVDEIVAACEGFRTASPILGRVRDMRDRVQRTMDTLV